jgi:hypothetical protein
MTLAKETSLVIVRQRCTYRVYTARCLRIQISQNKAGTRHRLSYAASCPPWVPDFRQVFLMDMAPFSTNRNTACSDTRQSLAITFDATGCRETCRACRGRSLVTGRSGAKRVLRETTCTTSGNYRLRLRPVSVKSNVLSAIGDYHTSKRPREPAFFGMVPSDIWSGVPSPRHRKSTST